MRKLVRGNIKHIVLSFCLLFAVVAKAQYSYYEEKTAQPVITKKAFDDDVWQKERKKLLLRTDSIKATKSKNDSTLYGTGRSVEDGAGYVRFEQDSAKKLDTVIYLDGPPEEFCDTCVYNYSEVPIQYGEREFDRGGKRDFKRKRRKKDGNGEEKETGEPTIEIETKPLPQGSLNFATILIMLVLGALLAVLVYYLFANAPKSTGSKKINYDSLEEIDPTTIELTELERKILEAKQNEDYRLGVRLYFIWVMKDLTEAGYFEWKKKKTNLHYLSEMQGKKEYKQFNRLVNVYEHVWYGKFEIDRDDFGKIEPEFKDFINSIKR